MTTNPILQTPAGSELHGCVVTDFDRVLEYQIRECAQQSSFCERNNSPAMARMWSRTMREAIKARRPEVVAAWEAWERQRLDEGLDYFQSEAAQALGKTAA